MRNKVLICSLIIFVFLALSYAIASDNEYELTHENGLYIVKIDVNKLKVKPYVSDKLETVDKIAQKTDAVVAINSGFFDAKNKKTVSYITENNVIIANPTENENLTSNINLKPYLNQIFNRGEIRLYDCNRKIKAEINYHNDKLDQKCTLLSSTQAGPVILPNMDLEKEFFILKKDGKIIRDGAGMTRKTDRSAIAIKDNFIYFIITDENTQLTIYQLREKLLNMNFEKALGFDGGGSVSMYAKDKDKIFYQRREEKGASRAIKSALIVTE